jgi:hypothetical protein
VSTKTCDTLIPEFSTKRMRCIADSCEIAFRLSFVLKDEEIGEVRGRKKKEEGTRNERMTRKEEDGRRKKEEGRVGLH